MAQQGDSKLNRLFHQLPPGLVVDAAWLDAKGYSPSLRNHYANAGWLQHVTRRVYRRPEGVLGWEAIVVSLQTMLQVPLAVGGKTALQIQGFSHYLADRVHEVHLYGDVALPKWVNQLPLEETFVAHNSRRLFKTQLTGRDLGAETFNLAATDGWAADSDHGLRQITWGLGDWLLTLSTPERALLEFLDEVPSKESFEHADRLVEGLPNLSPRRLATLLSDCSSVKVKRLFFFFADRHRHAWRRHLEPSQFDLGSGKRALVKGGKLNAPYQIMVPEDLDGQP